MTYKTGTWGEKAKARSLRRTKYFIAYRARHKIEKNARALVHRAVKLGFLIKGKCRDCVGKSLHRVEGHHTDYSKPLDVIWLCSLHHREEHKRLKEKLQ